MNIALEKEQIVKRINEEQDLSIIYAVKNLLEKGGEMTSLDEQLLQKELDISIAEAERGEESSLEEVIGRYRKQFRA